MNKIVWNAFKAVALSIIFVVVWSVAFYLFRTYTLNQRVEAIMVTMQQEVSKNNYLTPDAYTMYEGMLENLQNTMNNGDTFVEGFNLNYNHESNFVPASTGSLTYSRRLDTPANYGDVAVVELQVGIVPVHWFYDMSEQAAADQAKLDDNPAVLVLTYTYQVPCMRYVSITS